MCEIFNRTLLGMLGTLEANEKKDWKSHVAPLVHSYNCTRHDSTRQSPFVLMFGREPRLHLDIAFGMEQDKVHSSISSYMQSMKERLKQSYKYATEAAESARERQNAFHDTKLRRATIQIGDRVLVKLMAFEGKQDI